MLTWDVQPISTRPEDLATTELGATMTYRLLDFDRANTLPKVLNLIENQIEMQFRDIHCMFRLPLPRPRLDAGCNFAIAQVLLAQISGISTILYTQSTASKRAFRKLMLRHYWPHDPPEGVTPEEATEILYEEFRNPLTHNLGLHVSRGPGPPRLAPERGVKHKVKKYVGLSEKDIVARESSQTRPNMSATLRVTKKKKVLLVDGLYWGVRRMVERLAADQALVNKAEKFLTPPSSSSTSTARRRPFTPP